MNRFLCAVVLLSALAGCARAQQTQRQTRSEQIALGQKVYESNCVSCHGPGIGNPGAKFKPGTDALRVKHAGKVPALLTERTDLTPSMVAYFVRNGVSIMPFYRQTEIDDEQLAALGAYLSSNNPNR